ncbi:signal transduction histidine kinase [Isoptericola jiangsuensis]|uniref:histidine kinase n=1 Tax=Isoptericola jiangsuensis TaxID=548579 RepID=A0A2A9F2E3_9MICO|nr:ATP-binding protein [Isoptericola jiangsuensis]PFG44625.1 signal transduction histidine kinase [Isoptericola jiangsuensis]
MTTVLLTTRLHGDGDLIALRRSGREAARALGLDTHAQVRLATALSEVGRAALPDGPVDVQVVVAAQGTAAWLRSELVASAPLTTDGPAATGGVPAARRLVDLLDVEDGGRAVTLGMELPARFHAEDLADLGRSLGFGHDESAIDELRAQHAELLRAHDELRAQREDLRRRNAALARSQADVQAMYAQLSAELEETNSGVVALYGELDERGRELAAANEAKSRFLRNVSHELRTPVNSILGLTSLLAESRLDPVQAEQVGFLSDSAGTLLTLVDELLELARAEAGHLDVQPTVIDLAELFEELRGTTAPLVRDGVALVVDDPTGTTLVSDRRLVARIVRNLLTNAVKFTEQGSVRLTAAAAGDDVVVTVRDSGVGIPTEHLESVFEEFVQVPNHLQPGVRGTGLGLPYARRTAEALGGTLVATSEPGRGSTFTLTLPTGPAGPSTASGSVPVLAPGVTLGNVLVVDDDRAFGAVVAGLLRDVATQVSLAHDADHALALLRDDHADAVVLDVRMPGIDGVTLLTRLRAEVPRLPAVLMSSGPAPDLPPELAGTPFVPKSGLDRAALLAVLTERSAR